MNPKDDLLPLMTRGDQLQQEVASIASEIKIMNPKVSAGLAQWLSDREPRVCEH